MFPPGEGGEGEEPPAGYQEEDGDGGCPEDDEDEEDEEEEGVSGGSSGSPPRSPIPSSTDVERDPANDRLPLLRLVKSIEKHNFFQKKKKHPFFETSWNK